MNSLSINLRLITKVHVTQGTIDLTYIRQDVGLAPNNVLDPIGCIPECTREDVLVECHVGHGWNPLPEVDLAVSPVDFVAAGCNSVTGKGCRVEQTDPHPEITASWKKEGEYEHIIKHGNFCGGKPIRFFGVINLNEYCNQHNS